VIPIIIIAFIFMGLATILVNLIFYGKTSHHMPLITGLAASVNIGLNVLFIPRFGMMGAAYATVVSMAVYACTVWIVSQKVYRIDYERGKIASIAAAFAILFVIGGEIRLEYALATVALKSCIPVAFALFLWRCGIVRTEDLSIFRRRSPVSV
jgi:O-antigen/teichoic acid export membrane protein